MFYLAFEVQLLFRLERIEPSINTAPPNKGKAPFLQKKDLEAIAAENGHHVLFLPPYSPDFNPIENDFANIKKRRQFAPSNTSLDDIIKDYGNYLV